MSEKPKIIKVSIFTNGMVMVFGEDGQQIPELQGKLWEVSWDKIFERSSKLTMFEAAKFGTPLTLQFNLEWVFDERDSKD